MRDVEEVMVGFESTVESCQECGTLACEQGRCQSNVIYTKFRPIFSESNHPYT